MTIFDGYNDYHRPGCFSHVVSNLDTREHIVDDIKECWCDPEYTEDGIVIHNAQDGRPRFEVIN